MGIDAMGIEVKFNVGKSLATHAVYQMSASEGKALGEDTSFQSFVPGFDQHGHRPIWSSFELQRRTAYSWLGYRLHSLHIHMFCLS
jgi:hypothetical protein